MRLCSNNRCSQWSGSKAAGQGHRFNDHAASLQQAELWVSELFGGWKKRHTVRIPDQLKAHQTLNIRGTVFGTWWDASNDC